eukprot:30943-Pelagococcus_subviridis.AAC.3
MRTCCPLVAARLFEGGPRSRARSPSAGPSPPSARVVAVPPPRGARSVVARHALADDAELEAEAEASGHAARLRQGRHVADVVVLQRQPRGRDAT